LKLEIGFAASEVVFLVDRFGSMQGFSIAEVCKVLEIAFCSFRFGCFFNIVGFGNTHSALFPESRFFDDSTLVKVLFYVRSMDGSMGGIEIFPVLRFVLDAKAQEGLPC
jgi:hypothetical protein